MFNSVVFVLAPSAGPLQSPNYITSNKYVPERMKSKIDKTTSSIMENGLHRFYENLSKYLDKLRARKLSNLEEDDCNHAINIGDLKSALTFCAYVVMFAWFMLLTEVIMFKHQMRRNRRVHNHQP